MAIPEFTLTSGDNGFTDLVSPGDDGPLETGALAGMRVKFTSNITEGELLALDGGLRRHRSFLVTLDAAGKLNGDDGITMLANHDDLGLAEPLEWTISFPDGVTIDGFTKPVNKWTFTAPDAGETVGLDEIAHVVGQKALGSTRGPRGNPTYPVETSPGSDLYQWQTSDGEVAGDPIPLTVVATLATPTAIKTSAYTATARELVPADATAGGFTVSLEDDTVDGDVIAVKKLDATVNTVLVQRLGTDVFNQSAGPSSLQLVEQGETVIVQKKSGIWYVIYHGVPLAALDARYLTALNGVTLTGTQTLTNKTLTAPRVGSGFADTNGNVILGFVLAASAVNYLRVYNRAAGGLPAIEANGTDSNISIMLAPKNAGVVQIYVPTGQTPTVQGGGADTNHDLNLLSKGTGVVKANGVAVVTLSGTQTVTGKTVDLTSNTVTGTTAQFNTALSDGDFVTLAGTETLTNKTITAPKIVTGFADANGNVILSFSPTASSVNYMRIYNRATGSAPSFEAVGTDTNIGVQFAPKGSGALEVYAQTGQTPTLRANGADTNHDWNFTTKGTGVVKANGNPVGVKVGVPASASATGVPGQWAADASWHYTCISANTWVRSAAATW